MKPVLSFIIPTLREEEYLEKTLKNFDTLLIPYEVIVTDGGSRDRTLEIAKKYHAKMVVWDKDRRQTFGEAKNAGAELAEGEFLVFIDADVIIPEPQKFFEDILAFFKTRPHYVAATVPLLPFPDSPYNMDRFFSAPLNWWYVISNNYFHSGNASGEFQMIRESAFTQVRGYHEHLVAGEDNNMFYRLAEIGRTISYNKRVVYHSYRRVRKWGWFKTYRIWILNGLFVMFAHKAAVKEWEVIR